MHLIEINLPTPVEEFVFRDKRYFIKRDDLTHPFFSGNKARKLYYLFDKDLTDYKKIISHGSSQSNAMLSLSHLAKYKNLDFDYYISHVSEFLKQNPHGNYLYSLNNGMKIFEKELPTSFNKDELFIPEGGYIKDARVGIEMLADEIEKWCEENKRVVDIFLPSGTGTTALFLQKYLPNLTVYTTSCVGGSDYLKKEFFGLCEDSIHHPIILKASKKYHFAKLYPECFEIWQELKLSGIEFDLLYDPIGWITLKENETIFNHEILYIHQGGLLGNESMLPRYERKYLNKS